MSYSFRKDEPVRAGIRRIALEEIGTAVVALDPGRVGDEGAVHAARKGCKRLRGLFRLVRPAFPEFDRENGAVRDAARRLAGQRDAEVLMATLDTLAAAGDDELRLAWPSVAHALRIDAPANGSGHARDAAIANFRDDLQAIAGRIPRWTFDAKGFDALEKGLQTTYVKARRAMRHARKRRSPDDFHEWRKHVKSHFYHVRLLAPIAPDQMRRHIALAERLGEALGEHHDLHLLELRLQAPVEGAAPDACQAFLHAAGLRRAALEAEAVELGEDLLDVKPSRLAARWREHWKEWRAPESAAT